jgi:hypothetical protein
MGICRTKALISAPLLRVWDFIIDPRNLHRWATEPVTDTDRPLQAGDRLTFKRTDFFRRCTRAARQTIILGGDFSTILR